MRILGHWSEKKYKIIIIIRNIIAYTILTFFSIFYFIWQVQVKEKGRKRKREICLIHWAVWICHSNTKNITICSHLFTDWTLKDVRSKQKVPKLLNSCQDVLWNSTSVITFLFLHQQTNESDKHLITITFLSDLCV